MRRASGREVIKFHFARNGIFALSPSELKTDKI